MGVLKKKIWFTPLIDNDAFPAVATKRLLGWRILYRDHNNKCHTDWVLDLEHFSCERTKEPFEGKYLDV